MYYSISGRLVYKDEGMAVVQNNGMCYETHISRSYSNILPETGSEVTIFTKLILREDDLYLVGFQSPEDRKLYESLITVTGIGPKQGLKILSEMSARDIRNTILSGDTAALSRIKGIGPKTASRLVLELKDKMSKISVGDYKEASDPTEKKKTEILMAMRVLGYTDYEARRSIESAFSGSPDMKNRDIEDIIKFILSSMGR